jgi:hypothetical protein
MQAWWIGRIPSAKILSVCYGDELARTFTEWFRKIVHSDWYADIFPRLDIKLADDRLGEFGLVRRHPPFSNSARRANGFWRGHHYHDDLTSQDANSPVLREQPRRFVDEVPQPFQ